jgi:hypothetical protein
VWLMVIWGVGMEGRMRTGEAGQLQSSFNEGLDQRQRMRLYVLNAGSTKAIVQERT